MAKQKKEQPKLETKPEVIQALKVEVNFPTISGLKQVLGFTSEGDFQIGIQFTAKVNPFEVFRLVNLLKGPHTALYAIIGTNQGALDFKFDEKDYHVDVIRAAAQLAAGKPVDKPEIVHDAGKPGATAEATKTTEAKVEPPKGKIFVDVHVSNSEGDPRPFGLFANYMNGTKEPKSAAGRGTTASEAALSLLQSVNLIPSDRPVEPFEAIKYLTEGFGTDPFCLALADVIKTNNFDPLTKVPRPEPVEATAAVAEPKKRGRKAAGEIKDDKGE